MPPLALYLALYVEGNSDSHFLPVLIRRAVEEVILPGRERFTTDVSPIQVINGLMEPKPSRKERILEAARCASGYRMLIVHHDADGPMHSKAQKKYEADMNHIAACSEDLCRECVPIIPVRNIEAWMLADPKAILTAANSPLRREDLDLPDRPHEVEKVQNAKAHIRDVFEKALHPNRRGRFQHSIEARNERLAERIDLERLQKVPSFEAFLDAMTKKLQALNILLTLE